MAKMCGTDIKNSCCFGGPLLYVSSDILFLIYLNRFLFLTNTENFVLNWTGLMIFNNDEFAFEALAK